jgi:hypothetical protein
MVTLKVPSRNGWVCKLVKVLLRWALLRDRVPFNTPVKVTGEGKREWW